MTSLDIDKIKDENDDTDNDNDDDLEEDQVFLRSDLPSSTYNYSDQIQHTDDAGINGQRMTSFSHYQNHHHSSINFPLESSTGHQSPTSLNSSSTSNRSPRYYRVGADRVFRPAIKCTDAIRLRKLLIIFVTVFIFIGLLSLYKSTGRSSAHQKNASDFSSLRPNNSIEKYNKIDKNNNIYEGTIPVPENSKHSDVRCKCVCPPPQPVTRIVSSNQAQHRRLYVGNSTPEQCNCLRIVSPHLINTTVILKDFCTRCECKYQSRNTATIRLAVAFTLCVTLLLSFYMMFLYLLESSRSHNPIILWILAKASPRATSMSSQHTRTVSLFNNTSRSIYHHRSGPL